MKEAFWGVFIILLGALGIVAINLFQDLTVTTDQNYYLLKEATKAAMLDTLDLSYYRLQSSKTPPKPRIVEEAFVENLTRRFASSAVLNKDYTIIIHDIVEQPPKVSLSLVSNAKDLKNEKHDILLTIDAIYEGNYSSDDLYEVIPPPPPIPDEIYPTDGKCPDFRSDEIECISGDLQFEGWGDLPLSFDTQICYEYLPKLKKVTRAAKYKVCECGKWSEEKQDEITAYPDFYPKDKPLKEKADYVWKFIKTGKINNIDTSQKTTVYGKACATEMTLCSPDGINLEKGKQINLYVSYEPENAVDRNVTWSKSNDLISLVPQQYRINYPKKDYATITGLKEGMSSVTVTSKNGVTSKPCNINVIDTTNIACPTPVSVKLGDSFIANLIGVPSNLKVNYKLVDDSFGNIVNNIITTKKVGEPKYEASIEGLNEKYLCPFNVFSVPIETVPNCNDITIPNDQNSKTVSYTNLSSSDIRSYSVENTNYLSIDSNGKITVKKRGTDTMYMRYEIILNDGKVLNCGVELEGKKPPQVSGCIVGTVTPVEEQIKPNIRQVCAKHIEQFPVLTTTYLAASTIAVPVDVCGKTGPIVNCRGNITREVILVPALNVDIFGIKATINFNVKYNYSNWQDASLNCEKVKNRADENLLTKTYVSENKKGPICNTIIHDDFNDLPTQKLTAPTEVVLGAGPYNVEHEVRGSLGVASDCKLNAQIGRLESIGNGIYLYYPPSPKNWVKEVTIQCSHSPKEPALDKQIQKTIKIVKPNCEGFSIDLSSSGGLTQPLVSNSKSQKTFRLSYSGSSSLITNSLADWSKNGNAVSGMSTTLSSTYTVRADTPFSGKVTINAIRQAQGQCEQIKVPSVSFEVCSVQNAKYSCPRPYEGDYYIKQIGDKCVNPNLGTASGCTVEGDGKCYYPSKAGIPKTVCEDGTLEWDSNIYDYVCSLGSEKADECCGYTFNNKCYKKDINITTSKKCKEAYDPVYYFSSNTCYYIPLGVYNNCCSSGTYKIGGKCHTLSKSSPKTVVPYSCNEGDILTSDEKRCIKINPCDSSKGEIHDTNSGKCYSKESMRDARVSCN